MPRSRSHRRGPPEGPNGAKEPARRSSCDAAAGWRRLTLRRDLGTALPMRDSPRREPCRVDSGGGSATRATMRPAHERRGSSDVRRDAGPRLRHTLYRRRGDAAPRSPNFQEPRQVGGPRRPSTGDDPWSAMLGLEPSSAARRRSSTPSPPTPSRAAGVMRGCASRSPLCCLRDHDRHGPRRRRGLARTRLHQGGGRGLGRPAASPAPTTRCARRGCEDGRRRHVHVCEGSATPSVAARRPPRDMLLAHGVPLPTDSPEGTILHKPMSNLNNAVGTPIRPASASRPSHRRIGQRLEARLAYVLPRRSTSLRARHACRGWRTAGGLVPRPAGRGTCRRRWTRAVAFTPGNASRV